jgi:hypothetical protein
VRDDELAPGVGARRRKGRHDVIAFKVSSYCNFGSCVEVGEAPDGAVIVRDTKDPERRVALTFTREEWVAFVQGVKAGEFDHSRAGV